MLLVITVVVVATNSHAFENLSGWGQDDACNSGFSPTVWYTQGNNTDVRVNDNNNCASFRRNGLLMSKGSMTIGHDGATGDNDSFGLALGYTPGEVSTTQADYLIVEWNSAGLSLVHVIGTGCDGNTIAERGSAGGCTATEITRAQTLGSTDWGYNTLHDIDVDEFTSNHLEISVDGVTQFDLTPVDVGLSCFPTGGMAFYNYSQANVLYGSLQIDESEPGLPCAPACDSVLMENPEFVVNDVAADFNQIGRAHV